MLVLETGVPKSGKTVTACTFPKPLLYIGMEPEGISSVATARDAAGKLIISEVDQAQIDVVPITRATRADIHLETPTKEDFRGAQKPKFAKGGYESIIKWNTLMNALDETGKPPPDMIKNPRGRAAHGGPYRTLVIDSATSLFTYLKEAMLWANAIPRLRIADYGTLEGNLFGQIIPDLQALNKDEDGGYFDWVIVCVHELIDKDEVTGKVYEQPVGPSKAQGRAMPKEFSEVWRMEATGNDFVIRTRMHGRFAGAGSRLSLPDHIKPATYTEIKKHIPSSMDNLL